MKGTGADRRMPLLEEVFQAFPELPMNVDIKDDDDMLIEKVDALIRKYDREEITVWGNVKDTVCQKLYKVNPRVPLLFSGMRVLYLVLLFWTGLLPFFTIKESFLEVLAPALVLDSERLFQKKFGRFIRFVVWAGDKLLIRPALIRHLERRGIQTLFWVLNTDQDFEAAFSLGIAGVMTDRPGMLADWLDKKGWGRSSSEHSSTTTGRPATSVVSSRSDQLDAGDNSALIK
ncbi:glycerophosphodiester phosphodiesterase domain-containing protein 1 [Plakobranchus ocellatus]|uniref:Glycerophosphodiester phosphodiesterase domain-containing protein 1 n=1 Tax=Plakobranchus ocellatus TaxID=259542 RepID=A0AAV4A7F9_9GAST|nr:glycerophosphodiester phosphodiesterase domain-containing protein 1 [Plakobranchus ocellatus]